jgi:ectoine hydroxylase-related dioxygenase (phytanoyl-CoA dioxygenase family)
MQHVTVHIALDDQDEENGGLQFIPGSHLWRESPLPLDPNFAAMDGIKANLTKEELERFTPVCARLRRGEMSLHHSLTIHGSYANRSERPRRAAVLNFFADGTVSTTDEEILPKAAIPRGEAIKGQLFPIVFNPHARG